MAGWSPLSVSHTVASLSGSLSIWEFLESHRLRSREILALVCGIPRYRLDVVLASMPSRPGRSLRQAGPEGPFPWRPVPFI